MHFDLYKRSADALFTEVGDDIVALHVKRGQCYGMEDVTRATWDLLAEPVAVKQICERLTEVYDVDPATCEAEIGSLIDRFVQEGLVDRISSPA
jgi:hypothetical protein